MRGRATYLLIVEILFLVSPAWGVDWKSFRPEGYVSDFARVVDPQSRTELESYAASIEQATGAQCAFVTIPSLQGEPIEDVANDLFHAWGVGQKKQDNGLLLLLSVGDRKSRLEVGGGLGDALTDGMSGLLLEDMRPTLRVGQYGTAFLVAAERLGNTLASAKGVQLATPRIPQQVERQTGDRIPWPLIFIGIFLLLLLLRRGGGGSYGGGDGGSGFWNALMIGEILNSGNRGADGGGRDGGGFGGFDSGGSSGGFDGFGGGDSGGGGASSDW